MAGKFIAILKVRYDGVIARTEKWWAKACHKQYEGQSPF